MKFFRIWTDERGTPSTARVLLWLVVLFTFWVISRHLGGAGVDNAVWQILTWLITMLTAWAGGTRLAQYIFGGATGVIGSMAQAAKRLVNRPFGPNTEALDPDKD